MRRTPTLLLLLALTALSACTSQPQQTADTQSTPPAADTDSKPAPEKPDVDPYFRESSGISSNTGPQVITRNVLQDSKGVFWLATWHGVMRYDGTSFTNVTNKEGLRRYLAFCVLEDHQQNIWLGTTGADLYRYDGKSYTNFTMKDGLVDNTILSMMQDSDNNIWFGGWV